MKIRFSTAIGHRFAMIVAMAAAACGGGLAHGQSFVNFESAQVHPLDMTPSGAALLVTNTADNRLEVFAVGVDGDLQLRGSVPVGLEPVSVRAFDDATAWVVNHLSDSVSIVDLVNLVVIDTIQTGDEPADVVFAGSPRRAFVSVSQRNLVEVHDPAAPRSTPIVIPIEGEDPRALATDGQIVYAAIFEAGNRTTILSEAVVSSNVNPYPGDQNPPPNVGNGFVPQMAGGLGTPPETSLIVRREPDGSWKDDNGGDWSAAVSWDLHGHGLAMIDASTLSVGYRSDLLTTNMACAVRPEGGLVMVGTSADNHIRFEPNLQSRFIRVEGLNIPAGSKGSPIRRDLNPHLTYEEPTLPLAERLASIGDPRGVLCTADGGEVWVTGMGSGNVVVLDAALNREALIPIGQGCTGIVEAPGTGFIHVLNRFDATISTIDPIARAVVATTPFHDPTPAFINEGRPLLYDTHLSSGLGQASCASCHVDGRLDQLAWDLGDPSGAMKAFNQECNLGLPIGGCENWHPMKGPMTTQTLVGLQGTAPFHWRGDRENLAAFDHAFVSILGNDADGTPQEMAALQAYLASIAFPPNPNLLLDGSLPPTLEGGSPQSGRVGFESGNLDFVQCSTCHTFPTGSTDSIISANLLQESQSMKVPQLRNMYEKAGMDHASASNARGFGFLHDGSEPSLVDFLELSVFNFPSGAAGDQLRRDVAAFMLCWETGTHAAIGAQAQVGGSGTDALNRRGTLISLAASGVGDLVAHGWIDGRTRGAFRLANGSFQTDTADEVVTLEDLDAIATAEAPVTYMLVPAGSGIRIAIDRDLDGYLDLDETLACADPADPESTPLNASCGPDLNRDGRVDGVDLGLLFGDWGPCLSEDCPADFTGDGAVGSDDVGILLAAWGQVN